MTRTVQPRSWTFLNDTGKNLNENNDKGEAEDKDEEEDELSLLLSVHASLNTLSDALDKLDYAQNKFVEKMNRLNHTRNNLSRAIGGLKCLIHGEDT